MTLAGHGVSIPKLPTGAGSLMPKFRILALGELALFAGAFEAKLLIVFMLTQSFGSIIANAVRHQQLLSRSVLNQEDS